MAVEILGQLPALIAAGRDILTLTNEFNDTIHKAQLENRDITDDEADSLRAQTKELMGEIDANG